MKSSELAEDADWFSLLDLDAIADTDDKIAECEYFLAAATDEPDVHRFRWLISAFFGAAYSFFEIRALSAFHTFTDPQNGSSVEDTCTLSVLRRYVQITPPKPAKPFFVKTVADHEIIKQLYQLRNGNTHHFPLSIMTMGSTLPEDFYFGKMRGKGIPALPFCREVMSLIRQVNQELQA